MNTRKNWSVAGFIVLGLLAILGTAWIVSFAMGLLKDKGTFLPEIGLTVLLMAALIALILGLAITTAIFSALKLATGSQALGLPEGSIRAIIALSLILIFAITSIFMFGQLFDLEDKTASIDFAKQTFTTISTLVIAVSGFYFGAKSVQTAGNVLKSPQTQQQSEESEETPEEGKEKPKTQDTQAVKMNSSPKPGVKNKPQDT